MKQWKNQWWKMPKMFTWNKNINFLIIPKKCQLYLPIKKTCKVYRSVLGPKEVNEITDTRMMAKWNSAFSFWLVPINSSIKYMIFSKRIAWQVFFDLFNHISVPAYIIIKISKHFLNKEKFKVWYKNGSWLYIINEL